MERACRGIGQTRPVGEKLEKKSDERLKLLQILDHFKNNTAYPSQSIRRLKCPPKSRVRINMVYSMRMGGTHYGEKQLQQRIQDQGS